MLRDLLALLGALRAPGGPVVALLARLVDFAVSTLRSWRFGFGGRGILGADRLRTDEVAETDREHDGVERVVLPHHVVRAQRRVSHSDVENPRVRVLVPVEEDVAMHREIDHDLIAVSGTEVGGLGTEVQTSAFPSSQKTAGKGHREPGLALAVHSITGEPEDSRRCSEPEAHVCRDVPPQDRGVQLKSVRRGRLCSEHVSCHERETVGLAAGRELGHLEGPEIGRDRERLLELDLVHLQNLDVTVIDFQRLEVPGLDVDGLDGRRRDLGTLLGAGRAAGLAVIALLAGLVDLAVATLGDRLDRTLRRIVSEDGVGVEGNGQHAERADRHELREPVRTHRGTSVVVPPSREGM